MKTAIPCTALILFACGLPAAAQPGGAPGGAGLASALPAGPETPLHGLVPGVGSTTGLIIVVESPAVKCSRDAARAADGLMTPRDALQSCSEAIASPATTASELTRTLVNRGVLLMTVGQPQDAKRDFDRALALEPALAEAMVNRGAILVGEGRPREALAELDRGIALGSAHPERAYYHRGHAREDLNDLKGAYADYKAAEALKPGWEPVIAELSRFQVRPAP